MYKECKPSSKGSSQSISHQKDGWGVRWYFRRNKQSCWYNRFYQTCTYLRKLPSRRRWDLCFDAQTLRKVRRIYNKNFLILHSRLSYFRLNTHTKLYEVLKNTVTQGDTIHTTKFDQHVARLFLEDFEQSGINLDKQQRNLLVHLNGQMLSLGHTFSKNCFKDRFVPKSSIPHSMQHL